MMREEAIGIAREFPAIPLWETNIDAQMMWLNKNPEDYGVIVTSNMFGDIISDAFSGLVGGLGFANSANIGTTAPFLNRRTAPRQNTKISGRPSSIRSP